MVDRASNRVAFGRPLAEQGVVREAIAKSRNEIDQARLLCQKAAWTIDQHGNKAAHLLVSQIKAVAPQVACDVIDRAIQVHGAAGVSDDTRAGPAVRLASRHADLRRPRRGAHADHRARRNRPGEVSVRRGGHLTWPSELSGAWNFRDVADSTAALRPGRLFRSSELSRLDDDGRAALRRLGITDVADLRAAREVARRGPGLVPDGVDIHLLPLPDLGDKEPTDEARATRDGRSNAC